MRGSEQKTGKTKLGWSKTKREEIGKRKLEEGKTKLERGTEKGGVGRFPDHEHNFTLED